MWRCRHLAALSIWLRCLRRYPGRLATKGDLSMLRSILAAASAATLLVGVAASAGAQTPAAPGTPQASGRSGANVGSLTCNVAGGIGFVFGSSKDISCIFARTDGVAERYTGSIKKYGVE